MAEIVLDGVSKSFGSGQRVVDGMRLRIRDGEVFVLLGPSGCGKSTVLRMIAGLEEITSGDLWMDGRHANDLEPRDRDVAMIFQSGALYPHMSVRQNIGFPLRLAKEEPGETAEKVTEMARALGLDGLLGRKPATLSGGQRQRVAMGRAMVREPSVFLMDEPLSSLDAGLRTELRMEIGGMVRSLGATTVYVTHDQIEALTLADRIGVMRDGVLQDVGTPQQVYDDPATVFVAAFLSSPQLNLLGGTAWAVRDEGIVISLGDQQITLPWSDPRAHAFVPHHGRPVIVGLRPESLTPVAEPSGGPVLAARLRSAEFHGHEWMAFAEVNIPGVDVDAVGARPKPRPEEERTDRPWRGLLRRRPAAPVEEPRHVGQRRRTDLLFRAGETRSMVQGARVNLAVDLDRALFFAANGRRIDTPAR
ncbi:multiple sugar transport system ATP-binding protein [Actinocorallia herbida]|uniref:Multiple sugar transport system ATP-binding protein n=1 Tax=Actinocorallia herbida TaxID=58109 RepID=A0A3N1D593_9ACTN|nr:ABC transporter ATP-binding protein [Actinocorallia herbida]ROO88660.1 multiple sugar transport system ATP-binding protein [Actinocorallia herbida]